MIRLGDKEVEELKYGAITIEAVYYGISLIWEAVSSCFGGAWHGDQTWNNNETWLNE